jgi:hypothetical protein
VGDIGLPEFVGLLGTEAFPRRAGPFLGLRGHEAAARQDPPDRGYRRGFGDLWISVQMGGDGGRACVVALLVQGFAQPHDAFFQGGADRLGVVVGAA